MSDYTDLRARGILDGGKSWSIWVIGTDGLIYIFDSGVGCAAMCGESLPCAVCLAALNRARRKCLKLAAVQPKQKRSRVAGPASEEK